MKQALDESLNQNCGSYEQINAVTLEYSTNCECSVQESMYHVYLNYGCEKRYRKLPFQTVILLTADI